MQDADALEDPWRPLVLAGKLTLVLAALSFTRVGTELVQTRDLGMPGPYLTYLGVEAFLYGAAVVAGLGLKARRSWAATAAALVAGALVVDSTASLIVNGQAVLKLIVLSGNLPHRTAFASRGVMTALHLAYWPWVLSLLHGAAFIDRRRLWLTVVLSAVLCAAIEVSLYAAFGF